MNVVNTGSFNPGHTFMLAIILAICLSWGSATLKGAPGLRSAGTFGGLPLQADEASRQSQLVSCARVIVPCEVKMHQLSMCRGQGCVTGVSAFSASSGQAR